LLSWTTTCYDFVHLPISIRNQSKTKFIYRFGILRSMHNITSHRLNYKYKKFNQVPPKLKLLSCYDHSHSLRLIVIALIWMAWSLEFSHHSVTFFELNLAKSDVLLSYNPLFYHSKWPWLTLVLVNKASHWRVCHLFAPLLHVTPILTYLLKI